MSDKILNSFPELNAKNNNQINDMFNHYVFYKNIKPGKECWCTSCNEHFIYSLPRTYISTETEFLYAKHNDICICPHCHKKVTMKSEGIGKKNLTQILKIVVTMQELNEFRCAGGKI